MADKDTPIPDTPIPETPGEDSSATPPSGKPGGEPLSPRDTMNADTVFYYSREHRLSRASAGVQTMNDGKPIRPSLSRTLFATGANRMIFFVIIFAFLAFALASRFSGRDNGVSLGGNTLAVTITSEEGILLLGLVKTMPKTGEAYVGAVDLSVSPILPQTKDGEAPKIPPPFIHRIFFNPVESETFQVSLPFDGNDFLVILKSDSEQKSQRIKVKS